MFSSKFFEGYSEQQAPNEGQKSWDKSNKDGYNCLYINNVNNDNSTPQIFRCLFVILSWFKEVLDDQLPNMKKKTKKTETLKDECKLFKALLHMSRAKFFYHGQYNLKETW